MSSPVRGLAAGLQTAMLAVPLGLLVAATSTTAAYAAPNDLSSIVLSDTLPGFVVSAPGPKNGPVDQANVDLFGGDGDVSAVLNRDLADGDATGEYRFWVHQPLNGDGVVISAFRFKSPKQVADFLGELDGGYRSVAGVTFPVPALPGASGYTARVSASGSPSTAFVVTFAKGAIAFEVQVITASGDLTSADAVSVAMKQAANAPGALQSPVVPAGAPAPDRNTEIVELAAVAVVLIAIALFIARRDRARRGSGRSRSRPGSGSGSGRSDRSGRSGTSGTSGTSRTSRPKRSRSRSGSGSRRSGRSRSRPSAMSGFGAVSPANPVVAARDMDLDRAPPPPPPPEVGWHVDPEHLSEQTYWDGQSWVARRRWSGTTWTEVPVDQ